MKPWTRSIALLLLVVAAVSAFGQSGPSTEAGKAILDRIEKLRSLSDSDRRTETMNLALQIRDLPAGPEKLDLAFGLSNLSTEGDFGRDTLQAVTDTLAQSVQETPPARVHAQNAPEGDPGRPADEYDELAQLSAYEHMNVNLDAADYKEAVSNLAALDAKRAASNFTCKDIRGKTWTLSKLKGKIVVVNFWATWCPPCRKEMPDLNALYKQYKHQGLVILAISDEKDDTVKKFIADKGYTYPILLDHGDVHKTYGVEGIPKSFFYNRDGKMVAESIDMRTRGQFMQLLAQAGLKE